MSETIGRQVWVIPEGYIPGESAIRNPSPEMLSHEAACILNANDATATIEILLHFTAANPLDRIV